MTKKEQYKLAFTKIPIKEWGIRYSCIQTQITNDSIYLAPLLDLLSNKSAEDLLKEIINAIKGNYFDEYFSFDASSIDDSLYISPPNAIINNSYTITLANLKELLEEWILFTQS